MIDSSHAEHNGIPVSVSLNETIAKQNFITSASVSKKRILFISVLAILIGGCISAIAKLLV
jgi:chloride channel protein, CIC family